LPEVLPSRIERALKNGMEFMYPDGKFSCHYCGYYTWNLANVVANAEEVTIHNISGYPGIFVKGCHYKGSKD